MPSTMPSQSLRGSLLRASVLITALGVWLGAAAFFGIVAHRVAFSARPPEPMTDMHGALIAAAYSIGGALVLLAIATLALPHDRRAFTRSALLWAVVTALLLATRRLSGMPMVLAAVVALGIALDTIRRLVVALVDAFRTSRGTAGLARVRTGR
jgi:hypothetical protein